MTWGRTSDRAEHRRRGQTLTGNLAGQERSAGLPMGDHTERGSRGGAPIWVCREAWMPDGMKALLRLSRNTAEQDAKAQRGTLEAERNEADPEASRSSGPLPEGVFAPRRQARTPGPGAARSDPPRL